MKNSFFNHPQAVLLIAATVFSTLLGCESKIEVPEQPAENSTVSGTVTNNGKPVGSGFVSFFSLQFGITGKAPLDSKGKFTFTDSISPGEYKVFLVASEGKKLTGIPEKYLIETSSDYSVSVQEGENQLTIEL